MKDDVYGHIYLRYCALSGKGYVGQTTTGVEERVKHGGYRGCRLISRAEEKYGRAAFQTIILADVSSQEELDNLECVFIVLLDTRVPHGYNLSGGGRGAGRMHQETRNRIRD